MKAYQEILNGIGVWLSEGSGRTVESVDEQYINIVRYKPLAGSSYMELPPELRNPDHGLINLQNKDNECFRWCQVRFLNPQNKDPQRIKKSDKEYIRDWIIPSLNFQFHKNIIIKSRNRIILISTSLDMKKNNHIQFKYQKKSLKIR